MSLLETTIGGILQPDGTLVLDARPNLSPGRVTVVLRQQTEAVPPLRGDWFDFLMSARKRMEDAGCHFMNDGEVQTHIEWLREGDQIDDLLRETSDIRRQSEQP